MEHFTLFDSSLYYQVLKQLPEDQHNHIKMVHCLGSASDSKIATFNASLSAACQHCGDPDGSIVHKCWFCLAFKHVRFFGAEHLRELNASICPSYLLLGIPGDYVALFDHNFCHPLPDKDGTPDDNTGITYEQDRQLAGGEFAHRHYKLSHTHGYIAATNYFLSTAEPPMQIRTVKCEKAVPPNRTVGRMEAGRTPSRDISQQPRLGSGAPAQSSPLLKPSRKSARSFSCLLASPAALASLECLQGNVEVRLEPRLLAVSFISPHLAQRILALIARLSLTKPSLSLLHPA